MTALVDPGSSRRRSITDTDGSMPPLWQLGAVIGRQILPKLLGWFIVLVGVGYLFSHPLKTAISGEDGVNRWFVTHRTPQWNDITNVVSHIGNTETIIIAMLVACLVYWLVARRIRDVLFVVLGVMGQALCFLFTTLLIDRQRPDVPKLDQSPPTSSFPSGHTGASTALYLGLVLLCLRRFPSVGARVATTILFGVIPFLIATSRLYRGMHHPTDVTFGMLNGIICCTIAYVALRPPRVGTDTSS